MIAITVRDATTTTTYEVPDDKAGDFVTLVLGKDQAAALAALKAAGLAPDAIAAVTHPE